MKRSDSKSIGPMRRPAAAVAMLLLTGAVYAAPELPSSAPAGSNDPLFRQLDADGNGYVTRAEAAREPRFLKAFGQADDDRDGMLSSSEFIKAHSIYDRARLVAYGRDALITARVKAALLRDPVVKGLSVEVDTYDGVVLLTGRVTDPDEADRARALARKVRGVVEVRHEFVMDR